MCIAIHTITFACACIIKHPDARLIAVEPCADMLKNFNGVICSTYGMRPAAVLHYPVTCNQHSLASFQAAMGASEIYQPQKTSFESVRTWYYHKDSTFGKEFTHSITSKRIECFLAKYYTEEAREKMWDSEVMQPMFGYEYVSSKDPTQRGWKKFVGVDEGSATLVKTKEEIRKEELECEGKHLRPATKWRKAGK